MPHPRSTLRPTQTKPARDVSNGSQPASGSGGTAARCQCCSSPPSSNPGDLSFRRANWRRDVAPIFPVLNSISVRKNNVDMIYVRGTIQSTDFNFGRGTLFGTCSAHRENVKCITRGWRLRSNWTKKLPLQRLEVSGTCVPRFRELSLGRNLSALKVGNSSFKTSTRTVGVWIGKRSRDEQELWGNSNEIEPRSVFSGNFRAYDWKFAKIFIMSSGRVIIF